MPTVEWDEPPPCKNQPQDLAAWRAYTARRFDDPAVAHQLEAYLHQGRFLTPILRDIEVEILASRLNPADTADPENILLREMTVLWLNILSGRLNRATALALPARPKIETVDTLLTLMEEALAQDSLSPSLIEASRQLQAGQGIRRQVCARLVYRVGPVVRHSLWTEDGFIKHDVVVTDTPPGLTSFSPDYTRLVVETPWIDSGGGPIQLVELKSGQVHNLNDQLKHHHHTGPLGLSVAGWHPDNNHVLVFDQGDDKVAWMNLNSGDYEWLTMNLPEDRPTIRQVTLSPDGDRLICVTDGPDDTSLVKQYDFATEEVTRLATLPTGRAHLKSFRFSPLGDMAAYVVSHGSRKTGLSYALELFNLETYTSTTLIEGHLGRTEPVWSPDGRMIAFVRKSHDEPDVSGANKGRPWQGNIWVASIESGDVQQITYVKGAASQPVWSVDSRFLAFVTHEGEIGLVAVDRPGAIWSIDAMIAHPQFTAIAFVP
jgi:hypothetical protein